MRVLIISALMACAAAAPSGLIAPIAPIGPIAPITYSAVAIPAIIPTISPGDIQAAAIDAQVQAQDLVRQAADAQIQAVDLARNAADKAKEQSEQATDNVQDQSLTTVDQANEKTGEAFWSAEDKKWQAIDALKTAEAQIDGAVASNAPTLAKSAVGVLPYVASPVVAPISPVLYPGVVAPYQITGYSQSAEKSEVSAKSATEKIEEKVEKTEAGEAVVKTAEISVNDKPASVQTGFPSAITSVYRYDIVAPGLAPLYAQPLVKYVPQIGVVGPSFVKTVW